jgi:hypothetical protein
MDILTEIIEASEQMITILLEEGFFDDSIFIEPEKLQYELQIAMQRKWEQENKMVLTDTEFIEICNNVSNQAIGETLSGLVDKGAVSMAITDKGELAYKANPNFDINNLK